MTPDVAHVRPDTPLSVAEDLMDGLAIRHLPVVDGGRLVGILSQRDLLRAARSDIAAGGHDPLKQVVRVSSILRTQVTTVSPDHELAWAAALLAESPFDALPVVDAAGQLVGILSSRDFLRLARTFLDVTAREQAASAVAEARRSRGPRLTAIPPVGRQP